MTWTEGVTLGIAVLGAVLGIINTWKDLWRDRVRLRVSQMVGYPVRGGKISEETLIGIEVINRSTFPVTVTEVGFEIAGSKKRAFLPTPIFLDGQTLPRRLEPHTSLSAYAQPGLVQDPTFLNFSRPYARTDGGETRTGSKRSFSRFKKSFQRNR